MALVNEHTKKMSLVISRQRGLGIVEIMVSIAIGLIILAGVVQLYASSVQTQRAQEGISRIQENVRFVMSQLERDIVQTGFSGCFPIHAFDPVLQSPRIENLLSLSSGVGQVNSFAASVDGTEGGGALGTDTLIMRYAALGGRIPVESPMGGLTDTIDLDESNPNYAGLRQYQIAVISDCSRASVFMITNDPTGSGGVIEHTTAASPAGELNAGQSNSSNELWKTYGAEINSSVAYLYGGTTGAHVYSVGTSAAGNAVGGACTAATPQFCALLRDGEELVEGVQDFQVEYGWQETAGTGDLKFDTADNVADMDLVDRIRITITVNSVQTTPTNEGVQLVTRTFSRIVSVRNQLPLG